MSIVILSISPLHQLKDRDWQSTQHDPAIHCPQKILFDYNNISSLEVKG
jgi:hypothetical protein